MDQQAIATQTGSTGQKNSSTTQQASSTPYVTKMVKRLFSVMRSNYLHLWQGLFRDERELADAMIEWGRTLHGYPPEMIGKAIDAMKEAHKKYPPSLPEFQDLVKREMNSGNPATAAHRPFPQLPPPRKSRQEMREDAACAMEVMRKVLQSEEPAPHRIINGRQADEYVKWANHHRHILGMRAIDKIRPDGSFELV
jgi:hypothetical protein